MPRPDITAYINANGKGFHAAMDRVRRDAGRTAKESSAYFAGLSAQLRGVALGTVAGGLFAGGAAGIAAGIRGVVRETAALGDEAARAGLSVRVFQEWKAVAEDTRIPLDAIVDAFKELNIRADEFAATGKGSAAEAFARIGLSKEEVKERLKDPSDLILEIIKRTKSLNDTAAATRIFDEIFGGTGAEQAVRLLGMADGEIRKIIDTAHETGRVLDDELVKRAGEIDREFNTLWQNFETSAKAAILAVVIEMREGLGGEIGNLSSYLQDFANDPNLKNLERLLFGDPIHERIGRAFSPARGGGSDPELEAELKRRYGGKPLQLKVTPLDPDADKNRKAAEKAAERQRAAIQGVIDALDLELRTIGMSEADREKVIQLRRANVDAASEEGRYIALMVDELYREKDAHKAAEDAAKKQAEGMRELRDMTLGWLDDAVNGTLSWKSIVIDLIREFDRFAQTGEGIFSLFAGSGSGGGSGIGSLFSGIGSALFGGFRAGGGDVSAGRIYRINEKDYLEPGRSGRVLTPDQVGGGGAQVTYAPVYQFTGTSGEMEEFRRQAEQDRRDFDSRVVNAIRNGRTRRLLA